MAHSPHGRSPHSGPSGSADSGKRTEWRVLRALVPYLWPPRTPTGSGGLETKIRVVAALTLLALAVLVRTLGDHRARQAEAK